MKLLLICLAIPALLLPTGCLIYILLHAWPALSWSLMFGTDVADMGAITNGFGSMANMGQGLWQQMAGSLLLMGLACVLAAPIALAIALYHALWATPRSKRLLLVVLQVLQGIPPIVYGLCGLVLLVYLLHWGISLAAGGVILAVVILPLLASNMIHALERVPIEQTDAARLLGLSDAGVVGRVWWPLAWPGMLTGLLLGMARALSETAPILFTATVFSGVSWPDSMMSPVTTLQTHIFYLAQEGSNAHAMDVAWASAAMLLALVACFSLAAWRLRQYEERL